MLHANRTNSTCNPGQGRIAGTLATAGLRLLVLLSLGLTGCIGPKSIQLTRLNYDEAVHETTEQQWLRNIVRMRYGDLPTFLDISAITSQFELLSRGGLNAGEERSDRNRFVDLGMQFRDAPTLSYTPRDPTELTRTIVAPVGIRALGLMANSGWNLEDVLRVVVSEANGLTNSRGAEQLIPTTIPGDNGFLEMARLAGILRAERGAMLVEIETPQIVSASIPVERVNSSDLVEAAMNKLSFQPASQPDQLVLTRSEPAYSLKFSASSRDWPEEVAFRELLQLEPNALDYEVRRVERTMITEPSPLPQSRETLNVRTRTLLEMLTYLSKGVQVPEEHVCRGIAAQTVSYDGMLYDWTEVTRGLFHVCVAKKKPDGAAIAIEYEGYWFFIPASDKRSHSTLSMIQTLFNLQLSEPKKSGPLLTLPVGF